MSDSLLLDAEVKLANDRDGSYKAQLITLVEQYRDAFAFSRQGLLPPAQYEVAEQMEGAVEAALAIIKDYETVQGNAVAADGQAGGGAMNTMINI